MNKLIIFGTGSSTRKFLYENRGNIETRFFLDNNAQFREYGSYKVYKPEDVALDELKKSLIVVCSVHYYEIKLQLESMGLKEYENFIFYSIFKKNTVAMVGNCHLRILKNMLTSIKEFNDQYGIFFLPAIYEFKDEEMFKYYEKVLSVADVVIHQDISDNNWIDRRFGCTYVQKLTKPQCIKIKCVNTLGLGKVFYPYYAAEEAEGHDKYVQDYKKGYFLRRDKLLDSLLLKGYSAEDMIEYIISMKPDIKYKLALENEFQKWSIREELCDVKAMEYIKKNYKNIRMFYDTSHPSNHVIWHQCMQVCLRLGIPNPPQMVNITDNLSETALPIYPHISKSIGLKFDCNDKLGIKRYSLSRHPMDMEEYVRQYEYCYGDIIMKTKR